MQPNSPYGQDPYQQPGGIPPAQPPYPPQPQQPYAQPQQAPYGPSQPVANHPDYSFIMDPPSQKRPLVSLPGSNSTIGRVVLVGGGVLLLIIVAVILNSIFNKKPDLTPYNAILQDQQEVIHIADNGVNQKAISQTNLDLALTTKLSVNTDQKRVYNYLLSNGIKFDDKTFGAFLNGRVDGNTDAQLANAVNDNTYDIVFKEALRQKMTLYMQDLKHVYLTNKGPVGRQIMNENYDTAEKLLKQLNAEQ